MRVSSRFILILVLLAQGCASQTKGEVIYIARHGQTEWNRKARYQGDPDLDPVGYINRVSLWHLTKDVPLDAVYTSERLRTRRTADLVARQHKLNIQPRAALNEIFPGILEGICYSQMAPHRARPQHRECEVQARGARPAAALKVLQKAFKEAEKDRLKGKPPLGESLEDLVHKTKPFVEDLQRDLSSRYRQVLIVGHGVINRALLHHLMGWELKDVAWIKQANDQVYRMELPREGQPRLFLYTPTLGWKRCKKAPKPGQRFLDCNPGRAKPFARKVTVEVKPAPASQPASGPAASQ